MQYDHMGVERHGTIDALADEWNDLAGRVAASPFLRPGWFSAWWGAFGSGRLEVVAVRRDGDLRAILPLMRRARGLRAVANWHTPEFGVTSDDPDATRELAEAVFGDGHAGYVLLRFLGPGGEELAQAARRSGYAAVSRPLQESPFLRLSAGWDAIAKPNEKQVRKRRSRLAAELGAVELDVWNEDGELAPALEEAFVLEGSGWKLEGGTAIVSHPATRRFYTDVARWAAAEGMLRLFVLRAGGRGVATQFALEAAGRLYLLKTGFDPQVRRFGPGTMLQHDLVQWAAARGLESIEFLGAPDPSKLEWTRTCRSRVALEAFAPGMVGVAARAAYLHGRPLARRLRAGASAVRQRESHG